ncbi:hypothetical protein T09_2880 [Trichinella sp. T9]|nr:hypothetical protein T09_2880 [Trichinella sp. T9]
MWNIDFLLNTFPYEFFKISPHEEKNAIQILEFYKKVILKKLKKTIKVWSRRDNKLKGDCRVPERNIRLIKSPVEIAGHPTNIEADESNWIVSEPGNIFCFMDKPYAVTILKKSQATEPTLAACFDQAAIFYLLIDFTLICN